MGIVPRKRQPAGKGDLPDNVNGFIYPYGSDLHWLWGWGKRVEEWNRTKLTHASEFDWILIRPCRLAKDAMMTFSIDYPYLVNEISRLQQLCESRWEEDLNNHTEDTLADYTNTLEVLCSRIFKACDLIDGHSATEKPAAVEAAHNIPSGYLSKPVTLKKAAQALGRSGDKTGAEWVVKCIEDGTLAATKLTRQSYAFDLRQFPEENHHMMK